MFIADLNGNSVHHTPYCYHSNYILLLLLICTAFGVLCKASLKLFMSIHCGAVGGDDGGGGDDGDGALINLKC